MNIRRLDSLCLAASLLLSVGCLVRSVHPWLSDESRVEEASLAGSWRDDKARTTATFIAEGEGYRIDAIDGQQQASRLQATLHRVDDTLLLQIAPSDPEGLNAFALLPAHLLYKVQLGEDSLMLYPVDLHAFEARAAQARMPLLADGSTDDGYVLTGSPTDVESFLRSQLADPAFFSDTPHYTFQKAPASP